MSMEGRLHNEKPNDLRAMEDSVTTAAVVGGLGMQKGEVQKQTIESSRSGRRSPSNKTREEEEKAYENEGFEEGGLIKEERGKSGEGKGAFSRPGMPANLK